MRERTAQVSVEVNTSCGYSARAGFVRVSVDNGRDDARERARASMRIPRSAGCGHDWFSISSSLSWIPFEFLASFASASWGFRSVVEEEEEVAAVEEVEVDACGGEADLGRWVGARVGGGCWTGADARDSVFRLRRGLLSSESISLRRRFVRAHARTSGEAVREMDATSGSGSRRGVVARRLVPAPVTKDDDEGASRR
jgi:hypothetical protein